MAEDITTLLQALSQYETQLSQVQLAVAASPPGPDCDSLISLQADIEELISLTRENLRSVQKQVEQRGLPTEPADGSHYVEGSSARPRTADHLDEEYCLLKVELEQLEATQDSAPATSAAHIQEDLDALQGMKCQAPHKCQWGCATYHNALVCAVQLTSNVRSMEQIQVRVMFTNPTQQDMLPCPYYLDGACRFSDEQCRFSHGELVDLSSLKEYKEPDFAAVRPGARALVQCEDGLWHAAVVLTCSPGTKCEVRLESSRKTKEVDLHCILPLGCEQATEHSSSDESDPEAGTALLEEPLLTSPVVPAPAFRDWEKHTRGIGSRLMAQMGYVMGAGLGRNGQGRLEPVEALVFPAGKSLDHCLALREKADGDMNLFRVEKRLRRLQQKHEQQSKRQYERDKQQTNVFDFINGKLGCKTGTVHNPLAELSSTSKQPNKDKGLKSESCEGLNIVGFRIGEEIRKAERDLRQLRQSLSRHSQGSPPHATIWSKLQDKERELDRLRASERTISVEQAQRKDRKKLTVF